MRVKVMLACTECKQRNYNTMKNKKNDPDRIEMQKYCRFCKKHGGLMKQEVRDIALKAQLPSARRRDSQGICFLGRINYCCSRRSLRSTTNSS